MSGWISPPGNFYERLTAAKELPVTSHILSITYQQAYLDAFEQGYTDVINTTITSVGSNMFEAAVFGKRQFYKEHPEAEGKMNITVLDSGTYTLGYGYPIVEGVQDDQGGQERGGDHRLARRFLRDGGDHLRRLLARIRAEIGAVSRRRPRLSGTCSACARSYRSWMG